MITKKEGGLYSSEILKEIKKTFFKNNIFIRK